MPSDAFSSVSRRSGSPPPAPRWSRDNPPGSPPPTSAPAAASSSTSATPTRPRRCTPGTCATSPSATRSPAPWPPPAPRSCARATSATPAARWARRWPATSATPDGQTPEEADEKSDRFVGRLYARYVAEEGTPQDIAPEDAAVAHDLDERDDLAQELISGAQAGEPEASALWLRVRDWAVEGQNATLARLGVHFDRLIYDSDQIPEIPPLVELALERGVILREPSGALLYETGDESYPHLPLSRTDGFPTHHLRVVATWHTMMRDERGSELIHLSGDEWRANVVHVEKLLRKLEPDVPVLPSKHLMHGMVTGESGELSSGKGDALLIDDLLGELAAHPQVTAAAQAGEERRCAPDDLVAIALLGFCLDRPLVKRLEFAPIDVLLNPDANIGWRIALAWSKAWDPANDAGEGDPANDADYRFAVLQSQLHRRMLAPAVRGAGPAQVRPLPRPPERLVPRRPGRPAGGTRDARHPRRRPRPPPVCSAMPQLRRSRLFGPWGTQKVESASDCGLARLVMTMSSAHLNETDNYGPAFMRVAAALGEYDRTEEDAAAVVELLGLAPGARVLDAGCGFGRFAAALAEQRLRHRRRRHLPRRDRRSGTPLPRPHLPGRRPDRSRCPRASGPSTPSSACIRASATAPPWRRTWRCCAPSTGR